MEHIISGMIVIWSGAIVDIPIGWVLCNGANGTPDLRNRFVVGSGDTYDPDDTGGTVQHNHTFTGDGHSHTFPGGSTIAAGASFATETNIKSSVGTTSNTNHLPPYYSLAYIMKT